MINNISNTKAWDDDMKYNVDMDWTEVGHDKYTKVICC
jgi:hypothetical protein